MLKKLKWLATGILVAFAAPWIAAQTPTIFNNIQVNSQSDLRGNIVNGTGSVTVNDSAVITGALDQRGAIANSTGNLSLNDAVDVAGKLTTVASALGGAGLNLPAGTAPTSPVNGDVWTTTAGLFARINGSTVGPFGSGGGTPGGADTQVQFNDSNAFGGDAGLTYTKASQLTQTTNLTIQKAGGPFLSLNNSSGSANQKKSVFHQDDGFAGFCQLADAESDPSAVCDSLHPTRLPLSWYNTGSAITFSILYGLGAEVQGASGDLTIDSGGMNVSLTSNGELDFVAGTFISTGMSLLVTRPSAALTGAGLNLPHGIAPTSPNNGDLWTTTAGLFARINGSTVGPFGSGGSAAGADTQVQYNNSSAFGGSAAFTWNDATHVLALGNGATPPSFGTVPVAATGTPMTIYGGDCTGVCSAGALTVRGGQAVSGGGSSITARGGNATGNNDGGVANLTGGFGSSSGSGGAVNITGGQGGGGGASAGGAVTIAGGASGGGAGGNGSVVLQTGLSTVRVTLDGTASASTGVRFNGYGAGGLSTDSTGHVTAGASGQFTVNFDDACSTTPTVVFNYYVVGSVVTIAPDSTSGFTCTGDSSNFASTGADVPAALRPSVTAVQSSPMTGVALNAGGAATIEILINSTGTMNLMNCTSVTSCLTNTWTASGNRSITLTSLRPQFTYFKH